MKGKEPTFISQRAKEKADELIEKFDSLFANSTVYTNRNCALICVDEILEAIPKLVGGKVAFRNPEIKFWEEVRKELENR